MRWKVLAIGRPKLAHARMGVEDYEARLRPWLKLEIECVRPSSKAAESRELLERSEGFWRVALDERGEQVATRDLVDRMLSWERRPEIKGVALLIGGADGHSPELRERANWCWALSLLTLQHEMALVLVLEQLYRAYSIKIGTPYHRD